MIQRLREARTHLLSSVLASMLLAGSAAAQLPSHPVLTEAFLDAQGNDGPVGTSPANIHLEFIELYLPAAADLELGLSKDALNLTLYDVEGDFSSTHRGHVNWRIDLPTFDLDPSNGITPGAAPRPSSGVVVIGWADYLGDPPTDLAGTPSTRIPMVNGGLPPLDYAFVAVNGNQFGGTSNLLTPTAISFFDLTTNPYIGLFEEGSGALLLMDRDHPSYVELCSFFDPAPCTSNADLANGVALPVAPLLDAFAPNDDAVFDPFAQPYFAPTGLSIDLEFELRLGGLYSPLVPQLEEFAEGYARKLLDVQKTTEDAIGGNEDPSLDSRLYRQVDIAGPFVPTPGVVARSASPGSLSVRLVGLDTKDILVGTSARPSPSSANMGGNFGLSLTSQPSELVAAPNITVSGMVTTAPPLGQERVYAEVEVSVLPGAPPGETSAILTIVNALPAGPGDPPLDNSVGVGIMPVRAIEPTTGTDALGAPFQATALIAVRGFVDQPGVANEFAASDLGQHLAATASTSSADSGGKLATLVDPATNLASDLVVDPLVAALPVLPANFIEEAGPPGRLSLVETVQSSAEVAAGGFAYDASFSAGGNSLNARRFTLNSASGATRTSGSPFVPTDRVHYFNPEGRVEQGSGFWKVATHRDFELAILDTNVTGSGTTESGNGDDFGVIVKVGDVGPGSPVVPGEFVFLSMMGGRQGADIDSLLVPDADPTLMSVILIDLDPLDSVLDVDTVTDVYLVDANGGSRIDPLEVFSLNVQTVPEPRTALLLSAGVGLLASLDGRRRRALSRRRARAQRRRSHLRALATPGVAPERGSSPSRPAADASALAPARATREGVSRRRRPGSARRSRRPPQLRSGPARRPVSGVH